MKSWRLATCTAMALAIEACGDGGGAANVKSLSSDPPPVLTSQTAVGAALPPTPALTAGTYDTIAVASSFVWDTQLGHYRQTSVGTVAAGDLRISIDPATNSYTLSFNPAAFPGLTPPDGQLSYTITDSQYGNEIVVTNYADGVPTGSTASQGTTGSANRDVSQGDPTSTQFSSNVGLSYVSLGEWDWDTYDPETDDCTKPQCDRGGVAFVYGDRTPASAIPASGTATYSTRASIGLSGNPGSSSDNFLNLTADFGTRSIAADIGYIVNHGFTPYSPIATGYTASLSGSAPIQSTGDFEIPLIGSVQSGTWQQIGIGIDAVGPFVPDESPPDAVSGTLAGAFFGPDASEIGGTAILPNPDGGSFAGAFVAAKN